MEETSQYTRRLQAITEKRKVQEEIDKKRRELEEERLTLQQLKRKSLRDRWLMEATYPLSQESEPSSPLGQSQAHIQQLQDQLDSLQSQMHHLENHALESARPGKVPVQSADAASERRPVPDTAALLSVNTSLDLQNDESSGVSPVLLHGEAPQEKEVHAHANGVMANYAQPNSSLPGQKELETGAERVGPGRLADAPVTMEGSHGNRSEKVKVENEQGQGEKVQDEGKHPEEHKHHILNQNVAELWQDGLMESHISSGHTTASSEQKAHTAEAGDDDALVTNNRVPQIARPQIDNGYVSLTSKETSTLMAAQPDAEPIAVIRAERVMVTDDGEEVLVKSLEGYVPKEVPNPVETLLPHQRNMQELREEALSYKGQEVNPEEISLEETLSITGQSPAQYGQGSIVLEKISETQIKTSLRPEHLVLLQGQVPELQGQILSHLEQPPSIQGQNPNLQTSTQEPISNPQASIQGQIPNLQASIQEPLSNLQASIQNPISNLQASIKGQIPSLQASIQEPISNLQASIQGQIPNIQASIQEPISNLQASIQEPISNLQASIQGQIPSLQASIQEPISNLQASIQGQIPNLQASIQEPISNLQASIQGQIPGLQASIQEPISNLQASFQEPISNLQASIQGQIPNVQTSFQEPISNLQESIQTQIPSLQASIQEPNSNLQASIQGQIPNLQASIQEPISNLQAYIQGQIPGLQAAIQEPISNLQESIQGQIPNLQAAIQEPISNLQASIQTQIPSLQASIQEPVSNLQESIQTQIPSLQASIQEPISNLQESIQTQIPSLQATIQKPISNLQESIQTQVPSLQASIQEPISNLQESIQAQIPSLQASIQEPISNLQESIKAHIPSLQASIQEPISNLQASVQGQVPNLQASIQDPISNIQASIQGQSPNLQASIQGQIPSLMQGNSKQKVGGNHGPAQKVLENVSPEQQPLLQEVDLSDVPVVPTLQNKLELGTNPKAELTKPLLTKSQEAPTYTATSSNTAQANTQRSTDTQGDGVRPDRPKQKTCQCCTIM